MIQSIVTMINTTSNSNVQKLEKLFCHHSIARLDELRRALGVSGRSVFRILRGTGYLSSYK